MIFEQRTELGEGIRCAFFGEKRVLGRRDIEGIISEDGPWLTSSRNFEEVSKGK